MKRTNKRQKINKHQSEIKVDFSAKNISPFGGLGLFRKLVQKLGVEKALESINPSQANETSKGGYTVGLPLSTSYKRFANGAFKDVKVVVAFLIPLPIRDWSNGCISLSILHIIDAHLFANALYALDGLFPSFS